MKKIVLVVLLCFVIVFILIIQPQLKSDNTAYLRIHIRANSNEYVDQNVKYAVKESVVNYLTPYIAECQTVDEAKNVLINHQSSINQVAQNVLNDNGFTYSVNVKINNEFFPTRSYEGRVIESGYYDALIIELGEGQGDNWWCVVYPPLCFVDTSNNVVYKSKIMEIINKFFDKE